MPGFRANRGERQYSPGPKHAACSRSLSEPCDVQRLKSQLRQESSLRQRIGKLAAVGVRPGPIVKPGARFQRYCHGKFTCKELCEARDTRAGTSQRNGRAATQFLVQPEPQRLANLDDVSLQHRRKQRKNLSASQPEFYMHDLMAISQPMGEQNVARRRAIKCGGGSRPSSGS